MDFKKQEKYFIGKYFLKEFMNVKREDLEEPATIDLYMAEIVRNSLQEKETEVLLDEIYESGAVISHAGNDIPDSSQILERYIELYMDNEDDFPSTRNIFYMTGDIKLLLKNYLYEIAHLFARKNGISTGDTITEYDFGKMLYEELKDSEMTGFFPYKFEDLKKRLGL